MTTNNLEALLARLSPEGIEKSATEVTATATAEVVTPSAEPTQEPSALIKQAADAGAALAQEILEKVASTMNTPTPAQAAGTALGQALLDTLTKQAAEKVAADQLAKTAGVGDVNTMDGAAGTGGAPTKIQRDNASMVAEQSASIKPMPTGDMIRNQGSATDIYNAVVADMVAQGGTPTTQVAGAAEKEDNAQAAVPNQVKTAGYTNIEKMAAIEALVAEGADFETALEHVKAAEAYILDQHEKAAAVDALVAEGMDFDEAADLVKQAAVELAIQDDAMMKQAALAELISQGVDFDQAIELIKQAGVGDENTMNGAEGTDGMPTKIMRDNAALVAEHTASIKPMPTGNMIHNNGTATEIYNAVVADMLAQGGTPTISVAGGPEMEDNAQAAVPNQVKTASLATIMASGVDFDAACNMVKEASKKTMEMAKKEDKPAKGKDAKMDKKEMFMKKKAALEQLVDSGVDFAKAAALVEAKSKELFGE